MDKIVFIDTEVDPSTRQVLDIGGVKQDGAEWHRPSLTGFADFMRGSEYVCGHNILGHDLKYVRDAVLDAGINPDNAIDTLYLSPLLFPRKPYHKLVKDDKLQTDEINNPLNDSLKAKDLFSDEVAAFGKLDNELKEIYYRLTGESREFGAFFRYIGYTGRQVPDPESRSTFLQGIRNIFRPWNLADDIRRYFRDKICSRADLDGMIKSKPVALAYSLALINTFAEDSAGRSVSPRWVLYNYPEVEQIMFRLRSTPCLEGCPYCNKALDIRSGLKRWFGFDSFRNYGGDPLQEKAVRAAVENKSLLAVFPTGGGKSLTFQLPALMAGESTGGLTVVISPLQSLMKDQVDNLESKGITEAVTINGLLDPIERAKSFERVEDGSASILYIAPESLRSKSVERLLLNRNIARFVIDEAHCFSSWGQDFRVDYLYIAEFINNIEEQKRLPDSIPVSCFTATAKPQVIDDICRYFKDNLHLDLQLFTTDVSRTNLHYTVLPASGDEEKFLTLRRLLEQRECPAIVYVTRTKTAEKLADKLVRDGFSAKAYHGKMNPDVKISNQNSFMSGETRIIVATSAFGMGVDKSDVGLVVHYQISDSLENYVQEAGRAGRDERIEAECYVLFNEDDLSKHFLLLNQTKLTLKEIQQVWKAIKDLTRIRSTVSDSALEIARKAGWDDSMTDIETRVRTAIASLERAGYLKRGQNMPRIFATSILAATAQEAIDKIESSSRFEDKEKTQAVRIIKKLISSRSRQQTGDDTPEARVDYISDHLGITKSDVIHIINLLREEKILADTKDLSAYILENEKSNKSLKVLEAFCETERFLSEFLDYDEEAVLDFKALNEKAEAAGDKGVDISRIKTTLNFWSVKGIIRKRQASGSRNHLSVKCTVPKERLKYTMQRRHALSEFIVNYLYGKVPQEVRSTENADRDNALLVEFSELELKDAYLNSIASFSEEVTCGEIEDALFYLVRIRAMRIEGGFLVIYNGMKIERLEKDLKKKYKVEDYRALNDFYNNKIQQIHIVGEYARKMIDDYNGALQFVSDYFSLNYQSFLNKYFNGRKEEISKNITPSKFKSLFGVLSPTQLKIINDKTAKYIVVAAGPGSGKTKVLVHKLASLMLLEDVRHEQLLMLTFSRAATTEFKQRLYDLVGGAASFVEIKTFHSYCFDLLGRIGSVEKSDDVVETAVRKIQDNEVDISRITKTVLVIDEAQDMDRNEFNLVNALMARNEDMRVIAVGDDDQNIYEFRGSDPKYMEMIMNAEGAVKYELSENFRSRKNLVEFSNSFAATINHRIKRYPIVSRRQENGNIELVHYNSTNLEEPVADAVMHTGTSGSVCVMTRTNDQALRIAGLLAGKGIRAKLVQSGDRTFRLYNLAELRFFMDMIGMYKDGATVDEEVWDDAKRALEDKFGRSRNLELCRKLISVFESEYRKSRYKSDFSTFVWESSVEDFTDADASSVFVSTIHKVKGKEFSNVFLMLDNFTCVRDEQKRQLYVALTRAKDNLYIHLNTTLFDGMRAEGLVRTDDYKTYQEPQDMILVLTHKDVNLESAKHGQRVISTLVAGDRLEIEGKKLTSGGRFVMYLSNAFVSDYENLVRNGYMTDNVEVNMVVYWKNADMNKELMIVLPEIHLVKKAGSPEQTGGTPRLQPVLGEDDKTGQDIVHDDLYSKGDKLG